MEVTLADLTRPYAEGQSRSRDERNDALARFKDRLANAVPGRANAVPGGGTPDIVALRADDGRLPLGIDVAVWHVRRLGDGMPGRMQRLHGLAAEHRVAFPDGVELGALIVLVPGAEEPDLVSVGAGLSTAGHDRVVVGVATPNESWYALDGVRLAPIAGFSAAVEHLRDGPAPSPATPEPIQVSDPRPRMLLVADEWHSTKGGISTVNRELAVALARAGTDVRVLVPAFTAVERAAADRAGVRLVAPEPLPGLAGMELLLTRSNYGDDGYQPDVIFGHGRKLGPYAMAVQRSYFPGAQRVHIMHTDADRLEDAKEVPGGPSRMMTADERREREIALALSADLAAGIGPHLTATIDNWLHGRAGRPQAFRLDPGLRDWGETVDPDDPPSHRQVLFVGRADDVRPKGVDLAVKAVAKVVQRLGGGRLGQRPLLVIRGTHPEDADKVKQSLEPLTPLNVERFMRPYSAEEDEVRADLWSSRVVIMPSLHEGFGLSAYEAIAAGVPVLVTAESGLAQLLREHSTDGEREDPREVLPVRDPDEEVTVDRWANALHETLVDPKTAFARARELREQLTAKVSWDRTAADLLRTLGRGT